MRVEWGVGSDPEAYDRAERDVWGRCTDPHTGDIYEECIQAREDGPG